MDAIFFISGTGESSPSYAYKAVPWAAARAISVSPTSSPIDGGVTLTLKGHSFAPSPALTCVFLGLEVTASGSVQAAAPVKMPAVFVSDTEATCVTPLLKFAGAVTVHVANAFGYSGVGVVMKFREQALRLEGAILRRTETTRADADVNQQITISCPTGGGTLVPLNYCHH